MESLIPNDWAHWGHFISTALVLVEVVLGPASYQLLRT